MLLVAVPLALGAAASFAVANVAQMDTVRKRRPQRETVEAGVVFKMLREPVWVAGLVTSILGFVFEAIALSMAPVVLVQPLIVSELAFALPLAALVTNRRLGRREWAGIVMVTAGLMALVGTLHPADTPIAGSAAIWGTLFGVVAAAVAALVLVAHHTAGVLRTSAYAAAAGSCFGLLAVVTKAATQEFSAHGLLALATWPPYALAGIGFTGLTLAQNAYRAGPLAVSLPLLDVGEPLVASIIAVFAFDERLGHISSLGYGVLAVAGAMVVLGVMTLDRSPLVQAAQAGISVEELSRVPGEVPAPVPR